MEFRLPDLGEGIVQAEVVQWTVEPGDQVTRGQTIVEVMTDKATVDLPSPFDGQVQALLVKPGEIVDVGSALLRYESTDSAESLPLDEVKQSQPEVMSAGSTAQAVSERTKAGSKTRAGDVVAAPSVRRMARQLGIDLSQVNGSGPHQRILVDDLVKVVKQEVTNDSLNGTKQTSTNGHTRTSSSHSEQLTPGTRVPMRGLRRKIADRMVHASQTIPHFSYIDEVDVTELVRLRDSIKEPLAEQGIRLTYLPFFIKATVAALKKSPIVNASIDPESNEIVLHDRYHVGIATDTPNGLTVPVLPDADQKDLKQIAAELELLVAAARKGTATKQQMEGSTFTITSTGGLGGLISTPIINEPAVGIMGIGQMVKRPRFDDQGKVRSADVVYLSFSFDHRVVDGADAARFAESLINQLRNPVALLV